MRRLHPSFFLGIACFASQQCLDIHRLILEPKHANLANLLLRIASGPAFLYHGRGILFGWFGGPGVSRFAFSHHWPIFIAFLVGLAQVAGGLAILSGICLRLGAASIAIVMLAAIFLVHLPRGFDVSKGGMEYALTQLLVAGALLLTGPGRFSLAFLQPLPLQKF